MSNPFSGVRIDPKELTQQLIDNDDWDTKSAVTSKSFRGLNVKKKDKLKIRHEVWMKSMYTVEVLNSELSSVVDTMLSDQKSFLLTTGLLNKGQPPVVDTSKSSQGCPLQRNSTVFRSTKTCKGIFLKIDN